MVFELSEMIDKWTVTDAMGEEQDTQSKFQINLNVDINLARNKKRCQK